MSGTEAAARHRQIVQRLRRIGSQLRDCPIGHLLHLRRCPLPSHLFAALLLLTGAVVVLRYTVETPPVEPRAEAAGATHLLSGVTITEQDRSGVPRYRLSAVRLTHFDDATTTLQQPRLQLYRAGAADWSLRAVRGELDSSGDQLQLYGSVELQRGQPALQLESEALHVDIKQQIARSDVAVRAVAPQWQIDAIGMVADGKQQQLQLLNQVRGYYHPTPP